MTLTVAGAAVLAACVPARPAPPPGPPYQTQYCAGGTPVTPGDYQWQHDGLRTVNTDFGGGDGGAPVDLRDGRILWLFADTWAGYSQNNTMVAPYHTVHNSFVLQTGGCLEPILGGVHGARSDLIPAPPGQYYWPMGAYVDGPTLFVFVTRFAPAPNFCGCLALDVEIASFALPGLQFLGTSPSPASGLLPEFGNMIVSNASYHYLYGRNSPDAQHPQQQYVARIPIGTLPSTPNSWRYWNGGATGTDSDWGVLDANTPCGSGGACPLQFETPGSTGTSPTGPNSGLWVEPSGGGFVASAKLRDVYLDPIYTWSAPAPQGPWTTPKFAASTPQYGGSITYSGRVFQLPGAQRTAQYSTDGPRTDLHLDTYKVWFSTPAP